jgi:UDPglucose--hexose-1-phosphate uridylyltransferase
VSTAFVPPRLQVEQDACSGPAGCTVCREAAERDHGDFAVAADDDVVAWCPPASVFPYEVRIAPRRHTAAWSAITGDLVAWLPRAVRALEDAAGGAVAYNLVWHGGLTGVHAHVHLWAATSLWAGFEHGTDVPVVSVDPADSAARMRAAWGV